MDNREFAQVLLCEAAEILNEDSARHKYAKNLQDKEARLKKLIEHSSGERREGYEKELNMVQEELRDKCTGANKGGYNSKTPIHYMKGASDGNYINSERTSTKDGGQTFTFSHPNDQRYQGKGGRLAKNNFNDAFKGKEASDLNKRITERGKKAQNESISVLLIEAAELLNEATRQAKEEYKKGAKNTLYYGKIAAKEEATGRKMVNEVDKLRSQADNEKWYKFKTKKDLRNKADELDDKASEHYGNAHSARYDARIVARKAIMDRAAKKLEESKKREEAKKAQNESIELHY